MRHGAGSPAPAASPDVAVTDRYVGRVHADMRQYHLLEQAFCSCDALCVCGWDDIEEATDGA